MSKPYATITGQRSMPLDGTPCCACGEVAQPHVLLNPSRKGQMQHVMCLPCVGRAVESATGWRVMNAWSQWLAQQQSGQRIRLLKIAQKEARDNGLAEPTHTELPQWTKMK